MTNEQRKEILSRIHDNQWVEIIADGKDVMKAGKDARLYINNVKDSKNVSVIFYNTCEGCDDHAQTPNGKYCGECECEFAETEWIGEEF